MLLTGHIPKHVGIIMDGNGRWAELRGLPRIEGHRRGAERSREVIKASIEIGLKALTLYAFSLENWQRPSSEIATIMKLLEFYLKKEFPEFMKNNVVFKTIGETWRLPEHVQKIMQEIEKRTASNTGMTLITALSYSGRNEIMRAVKKMLQSNMNPHDLSEDILGAYLDTAGLPNPDIIIRTSGEMRMSNFLLWQSAYSELYFTDTLWPERRERRFGKIPVRSNAP